MSKNYKTKETPGYEEIEENPFTEFTTEEDISANEPQTLKGYIESGSDYNPEYNEYDQLTSMGLSHSSIIIGLIVISIVVLLGLYLVCFYVPGKKGPTGDPGLPGPNGPPGENTLIPKKLRGRDLIPFMGTTTGTKPTSFNPAIEEFLVVDNSNSDVENTAFSFGNSPLDVGNTFYLANLNDNTINVCTECFKESDGTIAGQTCGNTPCPAGSYPSMVTVGDQKSGNEFVNFEVESGNMVTGTILQKLKNKQALVTFSTSSIVQ